MSLPPATAWPRTFAIVGLYERHSDMNFCVLPYINRKSTIGSHGISWTPAFAPGFSANSWRS